MIGGKQVIGVCMTKMHWSSRLSFLGALKCCAQKAGFKLMVFNSFVDFFKRDASDQGAQSIYDMVNLDVVDVLVLFDECFMNKDVLTAIIDKAHARNTPVIVLDAKYENCFSILSDYDQVYTDMMVHVIREHHRTNTYYLAGFPQGDPTSERRIACYQKALEMCGLPFSQEQVGYGEYWSDPAKWAVQRLVDSGKPMPGAIFCGNDYMAIAVCEKLQECGLRVPEDVVVTGFDGTEAARYSIPQITTCAQDMQLLAGQCVETVQAALQGAAPFEVMNAFRPVYTASCGCRGLDHEDFRKASAELHGIVDAVQTHEDFMYAWMNRMFDIKDMNGLYSALTNSILEDSYVCLNSDIIPMVMEGRANRETPFTEQMIVLSSRYTRQERTKETALQLKDMVPCLEDWAGDDSVYIVNAVYVGELVVGYYAYRTDDVVNNLHKLKRIVNTVNLAFRVAMNYFRQAKLRTSVEKAALTNSVTELPNLKGSIGWFNQFATPQNRQNTLCVSVYGLPKYTYIQENYGIHAAEGAVSFVAEALKLANTENCFIGHIAEDEFIVINYFESREDLADVISNTINRATGVFFNLVEDYNKGADREYYVEVNCGCTTVDPGWEASLESFIKFAKGEMYMNRLKSGMGAAVKEVASPGEYYKAFELLIEKNLFSYHFQPIVNAKNGQIYGYEALMRTDKSIGMNPLEVLNTAREYNRLYEIEKATMFNIMQHYAAQKEKFGGKKVFINTIPGYFLNAQDMAQLTQLHGSYMDRFVFELTEQNTVSDDELNAIRRFSGDDKKSTRIAIDDYGTGHSNMANLLRYAPRIIKIDRFLIENIHRNQNKQLFVRSTVEFAKLNNILVLAEGVETSNELHTVIDLGVDLLQGFYLAKPRPEPIPAIPDEIYQEILYANPLYGQERA